MTSLAQNIRHTQFYRDVFEDLLREGTKNIRHTQLYKDVAEEVRPDHQLKLLQELLAEGGISQEYFDRKVRELKEDRPS
jgi:hypothetical protein